MRVLFINDYGVEVGGVETYIVSLKKALVKEGHDVRIFSATTEKHKATFSDYTFPGINEYSLFRFIPYTFNIKAVMNLKKVLKEFKPDIVHIHYIYYHFSPSILLALRKYPTIYTLHAHELIAPVGVHRAAECRHDHIGYCRRCLPLHRYCIEKIKRRIFKGLSGVINNYVSPSEYYRDIHLKAGYKNITVLSNAVETFERSPLAYNKIILYVGRLERGKGVHVLIESMDIIHKQVPDAKLVIVGTGSDEVTLHDMVRKFGLKPYVTFIGQTSHKSIEKYYIKCDVVVVPSTWQEPFGLVGVEAMSVGRPVIGTKVGGIPDWLKDGQNGFLIPPNRADLIAKAAVELLTNKTLLNKMSVSAGVMAKNYSIDNHAAILVNIYQENTKVYIDS